MAENFWARGTSLRSSLSSAVFGDIHFDEAGQTSVNLKRTAFVAESSVAASDGIIDPNRG